VLRYIFKTRPIYSSDGLVKDSYRAGYAEAADEMLVGCVLQDMRNGTLLVCGGDTDQIQESVIEILENTGGKMG
jgi:hypothetical protein